ncbi:hypothetical protein ACNJD8_21040, partial [Mycobacterium tuberculosis]
ADGDLTAVAGLIARQYGGRDDLTVLILGDDAVGPTIRIDHRDKPIVRDVPNRAEEAKPQILRADLLEKVREPCFIFG